MAPNRMPARRPRLARRVFVVVTATVFALAVSGEAGAQSPSTPRTDDLVRQARRQFDEATGTPPGTTPIEQPAQPAATRLTLDAVVKLALEKNLDIAVQRANPESAALSIAAARAAYLPVVTSTFGDQRQVTPPITILTGGERVTTTTTTFNFGAGENVPVGGGSAAVSWGNDRVSTNSIFYNFNPAYNATLAFQYTQPLLRGLATDAAREQIVVTRINRDISELQLQATIANTVSNVAIAYWDLVFAAGSVDVARQSLDVAHRLVEDNQAQVKYGTMTRLDLTTALSQEASSQHALVQAEGNRRIADLALKRLIVSGATDPLWQATIEPVDRPDVIEQPIDLESAVRRALGERADLQQARRQAAANQAASAYLRDQTRPQADLVASYGLAGTGGTQLLRTGSVFGGPVVATVPGSYGDALSALARRDFPTWSVALNFSYPVGLSAPRAAAARAAVQNRQVDLQIRQLEVQIVNEVTSAAIQVRNDFDQVKTARTARDLAAQRLDAEQKKFRAGVSTNYFVVQAQRDLADAENSLLQAEVNYRKALVEFDRAQQATLQASGVIIVSPGSVTPPVGSSRPAAPAPSGSIFQ